MKNRTAGHTETTISGDTRADWSEAFALVPSLEVAYEIAAIEAELLAGNPDVDGLCLALSDWSAELRILQREVGQRGSGGRRHAEGPPQG